MWCALLGLALAQSEPDFTETLKEHEATEQAQGNVSAELGGSLTTGNIVFYTVSAAVNGGYRWSENRVGGKATALWGRGRVDADGNGSLDETEREAPTVETARRAETELRYDRFFGPKNSLYALAGGLIDPYAGYDLRTHQQLGYSRHLIAGEKTDMVTELGMDYAQENYVDGVEPNRHDLVAARVMARVTMKATESFSIENQLEALENLLDPVDLRAQNDFVMSAKLNGALSMKLSHTLRFDNQPVEGFRPTDQTALVTLVATLL